MSIGSISHSPPCPVTGTLATASDWCPEVSTKPPAPALPRAEMLPSTVATLSALTLTLPPVVPSAVMAEVAVVCTSCEARRKIRPPSCTRLLVLSEPLLVTRPAARPMRPASAVIRPMLVVEPSPVMATDTPGVAVSTSCTVWPAASSTSPFGAAMSPALVTLAPTR